RETAQHLLLFKRLAKIISKLADGVDERFERRVLSMEQESNAMNERMKYLVSEFDRIKDGIAAVEGLISGPLNLALIVCIDSTAARCLSTDHDKRSNAVVDESLKSATNLQTMLELMIDTVLTTNAEAVAIHEKALSVIGRKAELQVESVMAGMYSTLKATSQL